MINGIKNWFWRSETILWARLQMFVGAVWTVLSVSDLSPVLDPKWLTYWLIFSGIVTELLRRRGSVEHTDVLPEMKKDGTLQATPVSYLQTPPPGP
jgi:hypothetical protein